MKPQHLQVRADREDGTLWIAHAKPRERVRRLKDVTAEVLFALCADVSHGDAPAGTVVDRDIKFADGTRCRVSVTILPPEDQNPLT